MHFNRDLYRIALKSAVREGIIVAVFVGEKPLGPEDVRMKKVLFFAVLVSGIPHQISFADYVWIERSSDYSKLNVVSDPQYFPSYAELYLGFFSFNDWIDYSDSRLFSLEPSSPSVTLRQVSPLLAHDVTCHLQTGSIIPENLCSIDIESNLFGVVIYEKDPLFQSFSPIGSYIDALDSFVHVKTEGPYTIGPGQTVSLNAAGYYIPCGIGWNPGYDPLMADPVDGSAAWWLGEPYIGEDIPSTVSYDYLTNQLGLSPGTYTIAAQIDCSVEYDLWGIDRTTITIIPEPCSLLLFAFGGLFIRKR